MSEHERKNQLGPAELLVVEAEDFPAAVIVELWRTNPEGGRDFLDSRRYDSAGLGAKETDQR